MLQLFVIIMLLSVLSIIKSINPAHVPDCRLEIYVGDKIPFLAR